MQTSDCGSCAMPRLVISGFDSIRFSNHYQLAAYLKIPAVKKIMETIPRH